MNGWLLPLTCRDTKATNMTTREMFCSAVHEHRIVKFTYDGHERRVEPYAVWRDSKKNWQLAGWSLGYSQSGKEPLWRCYNLDEIWTVEITDDTFTETRNGYSRKHYMNACCKI
jgi:hypothetical protein